MAQNRQTNKTKGSQAKGQTLLTTPKTKIVKQNVVPKQPVKKQKPQIRTIKGAAGGESKFGIIKKLLLLFTIGFAGYGIFVLMQNLDKWHFKWQSPLQVFSKKDLSKTPANQKTANQGNSIKSDDKGAKTELKKSSVPIYIFKISPENSDMRLMRIFRELHKKPEPLDYMKQLFKGITLAEEKQGFLSGFNEEMRLLSVKQRNDLLVVDVSDDFEMGGGGIIEGRLRQLVFTATEIPGVERIELKIQGKKKKVISGDGIILPEFLTRTNLPKR